MKPEEKKLFQEVGRRGGKKTLELYGKTHFKRIRAIPRKTVDKSEK